MAQGFFSLIAIMKRTSADQQVHMAGQSGTKPPSEVNKALSIAQDEHFKNE